MHRQARAPQTGRSCLSLTDPRALLLVGALLALPALDSCGGSAARGGASPGVVGQTLQHPDPSIGSLRFVVDPSSAGSSTQVRISRIYWGRLVSVRDASGEIQHRDFVVGEDIITGDDFLLETNPVTEETSVTIRHLFGTPGYAQAFQRLEQNVILVSDKSLAADELPPFPLIPRNAALVIQFDDLIDAATIDKQNIRIFRGYPPVTPFDARLIPDINHGDLAEYDGLPGLEFHTTRVIVDTTVSQIEAVASDPPLPVNSLGLPASLTTTQPNIAVRIPTRRDPATGQLTRLQNLTAHAVSITNNGSVDNLSPTRDIVRALRSGGAALGDANNGFLSDPFRPSLLGQQAVVLGAIEATAVEGVYKTSLSYVTANCSSGLRMGDVIQQTGVFAEIVCPPGAICSPTSLATGNPLGANVADVYFRVVHPLGSTLSSGQVAQVAMRFNPTIHFGKEGCFLRFPNVVSAPVTGVSPDSTVIVRFSEPIDPASIKPFDSFTLTRVQTSLNPTASDYIVGGISESTDLREFTFIPVLPLRHTAGTAEQYYVRLLAGATGPTDLSGNTLEEELPEIRFTLLASAGTQNTAGFALRFGSSDELFGDGLPELRGQFLLDFERREIRPRPISRFTAVADRSQSVPSLMQPFSPGVQTPLSKLGSKLQTLWRFCDMGFGLTDEQTTNVDIEGSAWAPFGGAVIADNYGRFEMSLSHSKYTPDEYVDPIQLLVVYPNSGLVATFAQNFLDPVGDTQRHVHPGPFGRPGYNVQPTDTFVATTGTVMMPWPLNRGIPRSQHTYFTYRDTAKTAVGGPSGPGVPPNNWYVVNQIPLTPAPQRVYNVNQVPTIGLPILMEFRCYPDNSALGLNAFDIALSNASSAKPNFRAFSTGGVNTSNQTVTRDPDLEFVAQGGFNPTSNPPGANTLPADNSFYIGQLDLVVRVSRVHTIWFDAGSTAANVVYSQPVLEPRASEQAAGTQIELAYRGASNVANSVLRTDADGLNAYGEKRDAGGANPTFHNGDSSWKSSINSIDQAKYFQVRLTFISNAESGLSPTLSALGFSYRL